jgi:hypothetical protein
MSPQRNVNPTKQKRVVFLKFFRGHRSRSTFLNAKAQLANVYQCPLKSAKWLEHLGDNLHHLR